jgi:tetratricopeptide (TPR) repeat protein
MLDLIMAGLLATAAPTTEASTPKGQGAPPAQAQFNEASEALEIGKYEEAVSGFASILKQRPSLRRNATVHSTLLMRMGRGLAVLDRDSEAEKALREGLSLVPQDRSELRADRFLAELALGSIELRRFNYAAAAERFKLALALADEPAARGRAYVSLARATMFDPGNEALDYIDQAIAITTALPARTPEEKASVAAMQTVRARVLLNQSRFAEAYGVLKKAVAFQGGLDLKVTINEIITRSDLAIAAMLAGHPEDARKYLAYTGAGRFEKSPFDVAVAMQPPPCGGPANLQPDQVAVVEFSIRPDGTIQAPTPIYSSAKGLAAAEFARSVSDWAWRPEDVAKIPDFFRFVTRVELRCSTSSARPPADSLLTADLERWLADSEAPPAPLSGSPAADLIKLKTELLARRAGGKSTTLVPILLALGANPVASSDERADAIAEARDIAVATGAPLTARVMIEISLALVESAKRDYSPTVYRAALRSLLARPGVSDQALAADTLKLLISEPIWRAKPSPDAATLLSDVAGDTRLDERHPLRIGALIRLAAVQAAAGDRAAAAESFRLTGLDARQCALIDAKPAMRRTNSGPNDFPTDALRWGFEGWVRTEYDIMADGKTASQRAIVAYPPFVFRDAAVQLIRGVTYTKSYRPDGGAACGGEQQNIRFSIPSLH